MNEGGEEEGKRIRDKFHLGAQIRDGLAEGRAEGDEVVDDEDQKDEQWDDDAGGGDVAEDPMKRLRRGPHETLSEDVEHSGVVAERAAVPGRLQPDDGVSHWERAEEEHDEEEPQIEVVGA